RLSPGLGRHSSPRGCRGERRRTTSVRRPRASEWPAPPPRPFGPSPTGVGWLAMTAIRYLHGRCPFPAVLGGIPGPVPSYRPLTRAPLRCRWSGRSEWVMLSQVHLLGGNRTHTVIELSGVHWPLRLIPDPRDRLSVNGSHKIHDPATPNMLILLAAVLENV